MKGWLSKIRSVHTYVISRTVYFGWICKSLKSRSHFIISRHLNIHLKNFYLTNYSRNTRDMLLQIHCTRFHNITKNYFLNFIVAKTYLRWLNLLQTVLLVTLTEIQLYDRLRNIGKQRFKEVFDALLTFQYMQAASSSNKITFISLSEYNINIDHT